MNADLDKKARRAAYMREWRKRRAAAGLPVEQRTPEGIRRRKEGLADSARRYRERKRAADPTWSGTRPKRSAEAHRAHEAVRRAVKAGRLVRPDTCAWCEAGGAIEAAHEDYSRQLDVIWLCRRCHRAWDAAEPKGGCRP